MSSDETLRHQATAALRGEWNDPEDVSAYLGDVPVATLAQWRHRKIGPSYAKFGRHVRYRRSDVEQWAQEQYAR